MKKALIIIFFFVSFVAFTVEPSYSDYIGTAWMLEEIIDDVDDYSSMRFTITFNEKNAVFTRKFCQRDKKSENSILECKEVDTPADSINLISPYSADEIHENQFSIQGYHDGALVFKFYIADRTCLLLPPDEAPDGCFRKTK